MTFDDGRRIGFEGESVSVSVNSLSVRDDFSHIIVHSMACTMEKDDRCAMGHGGLMLELLEIYHVR